MKKLMLAFVVLIIMMLPAVLMSASCESNGPNVASDNHVCADRVNRCGME